MHIRHRPIAAVLAAGVAATLAGCGTPASTPRMLCTLYSYGATETCYPPDEIGVAERRLAVPPVNPDTAVRTVTGLRLVSITVWQRNFHPSEATAITYSFGPVNVTETAEARPSGPWRVGRVTSDSPFGTPSNASWGFYAGNLDVSGRLSARQTRQIGILILAASRRAP